MKAPSQPDHEPHSHHLEEPADRELAIEADRRLIADKQDALMRACAAEIELVLHKYGMKLEVTTPVIELRPTSG